MKPIKFLLKLFTNIVVWSVLILLGIFLYLMMVLDKDSVLPIH